MNLSALCVGGARGFEGKNGSLLLRRMRRCEIAAARLLRRSLNSISSIRVKSGSKTFSCRLPSLPICACSLAVLLPAVRFEDGLRLFHVGNAVGNVIHHAGQLADRDARAGSACIPASRCRPEPAARPSRSRCPSCRHASTDGSPVSRGRNGLRPSRL